MLRQDSNHSKQKNHIAAFQFEQVNYDCQSSCILLSEMRFLGGDFLYYVDSYGE